MRSILLLSFVALAVGQRTFELSQAVEDNNVGSNGAIVQETNLEDEQSNSDKKLGKRSHGWEPWLIGGHGWPGLSGWNLGQGYGHGYGHGYGGHGFGGHGFGGHGFGHGLGNGYGHGYGWNSGWYPGWPLYYGHGHNTGWQSHGGWSKKSW